MATIHNQIHHVDRELPPQVVSALSKSSTSIPTKMRVVDIKGGKGPVSALYINDDYPMPQPTATQALVKIHSFGLNRMDLLQREGNYPLPPQAGPILGVEFSGTIVSFGSDEHERGFSVGDAVFGLAYGGAYAEYIAVSTHMLVRKPDQLSWEMAAGIPETWITATQALFMIAEFTAGKSVLWHAGASSVSIAGVQLSRANGASTVLVTASTTEKIAFCQSLGADAGFSYRDPENPWQKQVLEYTKGQGVDVIIDFVGGSYFQGNLEAAARDGRVVNLAALGGPIIPAGANLGLLLRKRLRFEGSSLRSRDEDYQGKLRDHLVEHALPKFQDGTFQVPVEKVFTFDEASVREAHELMASNQTKGKLIVNVISD